MEAGVSMTARTGKKDTVRHVSDCLRVGSGRFVVRSTVIVEIEGEIGQ